MRRRLLAVAVRLLDLDFGAILDDALNRVEAQLVLVDGAHDVEDPRRKLEACGWRRSEDGAIGWGT